MGGGISETNQSLPVCSSVSPKQDGRVRSLDIFKRPGEWGTTLPLGEGDNVPKGGGNSREGSLPGVPIEVFL